MREVSIIGVIDGGIVPGKDLAVGRGNLKQEEIKEGGVTVGGGEVFSKAVLWVIDRVSD